MSKKILIFLLLAPLAGLFFGAYQGEMLKVVDFLGHRIPSPNLSHDYLMGCIWAIFITFLITIIPSLGRNRKILLQLWLARCAVTLGAMLVYEHKYGLDAYLYYKSSISEHFDFSMLEFGEGTGIMAGITWSLNNYLPIFSSYHALKVIFSGIGLAGVYIFYQGFSLYTDKEDKRLLYLLGLFPSVIFWSSILGKDPLTLLGISTYAYGVFGFLRTHQFKFLITATIGVTIASLIRIWSGVIFLLPLLTVYLIIAKHSKLKKFVFSAIIAGVCTLAIQNFISRFSLESAESLHKRTQYQSRSWSYGGSGQVAPEFRSLTDMVKFAPVGIFTALFRPMPGEVNNIFGLLAGLENFALFVILITALNVGFSTYTKNVGIAWLCAVILTWAFLYGFISYQNLGSASRFKLQVLPFLVGLIFLLKQIKKDKLKLKKAKTIKQKQFLPA